MVLVGDLYDAAHRTGGRVDLLVANAPYVPTDAIALMPREARDHETGREQSLITAGEMRAVGVRVGVVVDDERDATIVAGTWPATTCESAPAASLVAASDQASSPCFRGVRSGGRPQMLANWSSVFDDIFGHRLRTGCGIDRLRGRVQRSDWRDHRTGRITVCQPRVSQY